MSGYEEILDWEYPDWESGGRVHNWKNYADDDLKGHWNNMTLITRKIVAFNLNSIASREEWD